MVDWQRIKKFNFDYPQKVTCKYCKDVRYYSHSCFYEDRCPACDLIAFDCRKVERMKREDVPAGEKIREEWA